MIEYIYDAIKAVAGQDIDITAIITNEQNEPITSGCCLMFHANGEDMYKAEGVFQSEIGSWVFTIPAEITKGMSGRYEYCIQHNGENLCFRQPFYLI